MVRASIVALSTVAQAQELFLHSAESGCLDGPCYPGNEFCGEPFQNAPQFHLMDQHGCGENDPNGPVFDPVHGVIHHFYQIHLAAAPGNGPDYGHFVSKDFVHWAALPVAIWNGLDSSVWPPKVTAYDNEAIYTGSAVVVEGAAPDGKGPGVVQIYPGLCNKQDWPSCETGTLLAQAVPADYAGDELLVNWTKPSYNPIVENTQRDPSTPWKTSSGEWRMRTYDSMVYGAASDADLLAGKWYTIGQSEDLRTCECPSLFPLPPSTPGWEQHYTGQLPTHVHKTSCSGDWWQLGSYTEGAPKELGSFKATPGWEDLFEQKLMDVGQFYASKDNEYPTKDGGKRRINWGWATVPPASTQTLPREITFNAATRTLEQAPIEELQQLRDQPAYQKTGIQLDGSSLEVLGVAGVAKQSELVAVFELPTIAGKFGVTIGDGARPPTVHVSREMAGTDMPGGDYNVTHHPANTDPSVCQAACDADERCDAWTYVIRGDPAGSGDCCLKSGSPCPTSQGSCTSGAKEEKDLSCGSASSLSCEIDYKPPTGSDVYEVPVSCGDKRDTLRLMPSEKTLELRVFSDWTFVEAFFQKGRVAMVVNNAMGDSTDLALTATVPMTASATAYPMQSIWVEPDAVRKAPRVFQ